MSYNECRALSHSHGAPVLCVTNERVAGECARDISLPRRELSRMKFAQACNRRGPLASDLASRETYRVARDNTPAIMPKRR